MQYSVLTAHSLGDLLSEDKATKVLWCGWQNIMSDPNVCELHLSALRDNFVAVKATKPGVFPLGRYEGAGRMLAQRLDAHLSNLLFQVLVMFRTMCTQHPTTTTTCAQSMQRCHACSFPDHMPLLLLSSTQLFLTDAQPHEPLHDDCAAGQSAPECTLDAKTEFPSDMGRGFVMTMAAVALFVNAKHLARSQAFRLTSGGLLSISGVAVLVLIVIMRWVGQKGCVCVECVVNCVAAGVAVLQGPRVAAAGQQYARHIVGLPAQDAACAACSLPSRAPLMMLSHHTASCTVVLMLCVLAAAAAVTARRPCLCCRTGTPLPSVP